jgi:hypothetical protein
MMTDLTPERIRAIDDYRLKKEKLWQAEDELALAALECRSSGINPEFITETGYGPK